MRTWGPLTAVCLGTFMLLLDVTIAVVALPDMARGLHASLSDLQWVMDGYALALAALLLGLGAAADVLGRRRVHVAGVVLFAVASLLCGLATGPGMLVAARGLQGLGAAAMFATTLPLLGSVYQGHAAVDGARGVGRGQRGGGGRGPGAGRAAHRRSGLALDLLGEPAGERGGGLADAARGAGVPRGGRAPRGLGGHGHLRGVRRGGDVRGGTGRVARVDGGRHARLLRARGGGAGRVRRGGAPGRRSAARSAAVPAARVLGRDAGRAGLQRGGVRCDGVHLHMAPDDAGDEPGAGRPGVRVAVAGVVRGGRGGRAAAARGRRRG